MMISTKKRRVLETCSLNKKNKILESCTSLKKTTTTTRTVYLPSDLVTLSPGKNKILEPCSSKKKKKKTVYLASDLVTDILLRLPVKSLQRLRCVCKQWNSMITDQDGFFVSQHLKNNRTRYPDVMSFSCKRSHPHRADVTKPLLLNYSAQVCFDISYGFPQDNFTLFVTNSCDGLIGVFSTYSPLFYVLNPSIGKVIALSKEADQYDVFGRWPESFIEGGIFFDASVGKYKAVRLFEVRRRVVGCEVYTLGDYCGRWKYVCEAPFRPCDWCEQHSGDTHLPGPVLVNGVIYWTVFHIADQGLEPEIALSFDPTKNKFDVYQHPKMERRPDSSRLVVLDEQLCIADTIDRKIIIWMMKDHGKREWIKWYKINLEAMRRTRYMDGHDTCYFGWYFLSMPLTVRKDKIVVICNGRGLREYYDLEEKKFVSYEILYNDHQSHELLFTYTHSLIWPWPNM